MPRDSKTFEVDKPVSEVYRQWSNFENLQEFAHQVKEVRRTGERTTHWVAEAMGTHQEWDAETTAMEENRRIAWRSTSGFQNSGEVLFEPLGDNRTRVTVHFEYHPFGGGPQENQIEGELDEATTEAQSTLEQR